MIKQVVSYVDFNDQPRTDELYFHLSKPELIELEASSSGGLEKMIGDIQKSNNAKEILDIFKKILLLSYGKRTDDGRSFLKNQTLVDEFQQSLAYEAFYMMLIEDADAAALFIRGLLPKDIQASIEEDTKKQKSLAQDKPNYPPPTPLSAQN